MIAVAFRFLSLILIVIALMLLGADVITSLEKGQVAVRSIDQVWGLFDLGSLNAFKGWAAASLPGPMPNWLYSLLGMWAFGLFGVLGVLIAFLFGRRHAED